MFWRISQVEKRSVLIIVIFLVLIIIFAVQEPVWHMVGVCIVIDFAVVIDMVSDVVVVDLEVLATFVAFFLGH